MKHQGKVPRRDAPPTLVSVSLETIQEMSEIFIFADTDGRISQFVCNGRSVSINGTWLQLPFLEKIQEEVGYGFDR